MRLLAILLACFALASCGSGAEEQPGHPALWEVSGRDGAVKGWLFGTVHVLPSGARWETARLDRALDRTGVLVVEVANLGDSAAISAIFNKLATDNPGPPLDQRLDPAQRNRLDALLARDSVDPHRFDGLETWAAALAIAQLDETGDAANGADRVLLAKFQGRPIAEVEGAQAQLSIFDRLPPHDQRDLLMGVVSESDAASQTQDQLAQAWLDGNTAEIDRLSRTGILSYPDLYRALLSGRNQAWAGKIAAMLDSGRRPFVAVGAAHMLGPEGLPALLAARGYTVRRIQ